MDNKIHGNGEDLPVGETLVTAEREDLFPEEEGEVVNTMDITRKIYAIRQVEKLQAQYELQEEESRQFYSRKKQQCQERIDYIKRNILNFLQQAGMKNIQTPNGTAYQRAVTTRHWPPDADLLAWVTIHRPEAVRMRQEPDKKLIIEHIKITGEIPDGYTETEDIRLYLK